MEDQGKRLLIAVVLALGIVVLWNFLFPSDKPTPKPTPTPDEVVETQKTWESRVGKPREGEPAPVAEAAAPEQTIDLQFADFDVSFSNQGGVLSSWQLTEAKYERDPLDGELVTGPGAFFVNFVDSTAVIPTGATWIGEQLSATEVRYVYRGPDLEVVKTYKIYPTEYLLDLTVEVKKLSPGEARQRLAVTLYGAQDPKQPTGGGYGRTSRVTNAACYLNGGIRERSARWLHENGPDERSGTVRWTGFLHPYLFFAVAPRDPTKENLSCNMYPVEAIAGGMQVDLVFAGSTLKMEDPGPLRRQMVAYLGPKSLTKLEGASEVAGFATTFEESIDMGWFAFIAEPLLWLLTWLYGLTGNWGIAIILLTVLVKLATLYWTTKSMRSMKAMASLKPHMDALQKKHGDDKQKIQQEMMALYKQHGVNPLAGCLPMLLQMPIWLALYRMLSSVGELYLSTFIPGWLTDLTETDPYYILPIVLVATMFLQSKTSPASLDSMQQKILVYGMPLVFGVMSFFFPSGLTLYILTNTVLSLLHTLYLRKFDKPSVPPPPVPVKPASDAAKPRDEARRRDERAGKGGAKGGARKAPVTRRPVADDAGESRADDLDQVEDPDDLERDGTSTRSRIRTTSSAMAPAVPTRTRTRTPTVTTTDAPRAPARRATSSSHPPARRPRRGASASAASTEERRTA